MSSARMFLGISGSETLLIPSGRTFTESPIQFKREGRTASAKLVRDVIATKREFSLNYSTTTNEVKEQLETIFDLDATLNFRVERRDGSIDDFAVLMHPVESTRINAHGKWLHSVSTLLEEV